MVYSLGKNRLQDIRLRRRWDDWPTELRVAVGDCIHMHPDRLRPRRGFERTPRRRTHCNSVTWSWTPYSFILDGASLYLVAQAAKLANFQRPAPPTSNPASRNPRGPMSGPHHPSHLLYPNILPQLITAPSRKYTVGQLDQIPEIHVPESTEPERAISHLEAEKG